MEQRNPLPSSFCIRSVDCGSARARVFEISVVALAKYDITPVLPGVLPGILSATGRGGLETISESLSRLSGAPVLVQQIGSLELTGNQYPIVLPPLDKIFDDPIGRIIIAETQRLADLLGTFEPERLTPHIGYFSPDYWRIYCRQNIARVYHLVHLLHDLGLTSGSVLEVGTLMGNFSASLQRLGYNVTAVDRYRAYGSALRGYTDYMRSIGVRIVETDREDEEQVIRELGQYDAVISMAVVEHIPHTPRLFLKMLASHVKPGGILALDTPNIARYWNRRTLSQGRSVHQDLAVQFNCEPPYEGHHREYTADEVIWMLEQAGCSDIEVRLFDYNLFGFESLEQAHAEAMLTMILDPSQTDTILAAGRI